MYNFCIFVPFFNDTWLSLPGSWHKKWSPYSFHQNNVSSCSTWSFGTYKYIKEEDLRMSHTSTWLKSDFISISKFLSLFEFNVIVSMLPARHRNQSYVSWRFQRVGMGLGWGWGWGWGLTINNNTASNCWNPYYALSIKKKFPSGTRNKDLQCWF